jgi:serine/threonine protein kinase
MTTRDPRYRDPARPGPQSQGRDPTQSLSLSPGEEDEAPPEVEESSHPSLALGTHGQREERTKIESPGARVKTSAPPARGKPPPIPVGSDEPDRVGQVLGSYRVLELLGRGGMGYVFRAEHVKLGREVALKLLRSDYARRRDAVARFFQEARTVNRVRHRNIVDVTDFVELDDGTTFIIMEFLRGQSLGKWARTGIDLPRALAVLVQICDGLGAAHQVDVVHRDLKPDNVIIVPTSDGAELVKLLDFGVAKLLNRDDEDVGFQTAAGSVIGTPAYMSPEQAGGMAIDARSDIYSLGAIMYELFCGQPMFRGRSFGEYVRKHLTENPVPPRQTPQGGEIDPRLEALILRSLEKEPDRRFAHIFELRDGLLGLLGGMETHPPTYASYASMVHPPSAVYSSVGAPLPPVPLPTAPIAPAPTPVGTSGLHASQLYYSSNHYSQISSLPPPTTGVQQRPTPWWVWTVGGAVAVALGITAAVWYANRSEPAAVVAEPRPSPAPPPPPAPVTPTDEPAPTPQPTVAAIELRFDSLPAAGVYADGRSAELCRTPCAHRVDPRDGEQLTFVVRAAGYKDATLVVDLKGEQRDFKVSLDQLVADRAEPDRAEPDRPVRGKKGKGKRGKETAKAEPDKVETKSEPEPKLEPKPEPKPEPVVEWKPEPAESKKPDKKPPDKSGIDPSDTLDPFKRKK